MNPNIGQGDKAMQFRNIVPIERYIFPIISTIDEILGALSLFENICYRFEGVLFNSNSMVDSTAIASRCTSSKSIIIIMHWSSFVYDFIKSNSLKFADSKIKQSSVAGIHQHEIWTEAKRSERWWWWWKKYQTKQKNIWYMRLNMKNWSLYIFQEYSA